MPLSRLVTLLGHHGSIQRLISLFSTTTYTCAERFWLARAVASDWAAKRAACKRAPKRPPRAAAALPRHPSALPKHARSLARPQHLAPPQSLARHRLVSPSNPSRRRKVPRRSESGTRRRTRPAGDAARSPSTFRRRCAPRAATRAPRCAGLTGPRKRCGGARTARAACAT